MRAPLSIVIPTLNAGHDLPGALAALMEGVEAGLVRELIISDGGSQDDTQAVAIAAGAELVTGEAGRGRQLARGAAAASGAWMFFLHADSWPAPGWSAVVADHIVKGEARAGVFRLRFRATGLGAGIVAGWANLRSRMFRLPYGDQGLLISRAQYNQVGGYQDIALMEDVAMARALGGRFDLLTHRVETGAGRYLRGGWFWTGTGNMLTLLRYFSGVDPQKLASSYRRRGR